MRIASWNVNSVRQRTEHLVAWLKETSPDIVCLQELKCTEDTFPTAEIESLGYNIAVLGQKTFNGVALLSKYQLEDVTRGLPGDDQENRPATSRLWFRCRRVSFESFRSICRTATRSAPKNTPTRLLGSTA